MKKTLPMIFQNDSVECGLAALAMILHFHGHGISLSTLREKHPVSLSGVSLATLVTIANDYKLSCQVLRIEVEEVKKIRVPAILHWNLNHFVVLKKVNQKTITLHDPGKGVVTISKKAFSEKFSGIVLECFPQPSFIIKPRERSASFTSWFRYLPNSKSLLVKTAIFTLLYQAFLLIMPKYLRIVVDQVIPQHKINLLWAVALGFIGLRILSTVAKALKTCCIHVLDRNISFCLSKNIGEKIMRLPLVYFEKHYLGDILNRFNAIEQLRVIFSSGLLEGFLGGFLALTTFIVMTCINGSLAFTSFIISCLYLTLRFKLIHHYKMNTAEMLSAKSREQMCFLENIRGIQPIKIFSKENERLSLWMSRYQYFLQTAHINSLLKSLSDYSKELFVGLEIIVIIFLAATKIMQHRFSIGLFYSYLFYRQQFSDSLMMFAEKINDLKMLTLYRDRLEDFVAEGKESSSVCVKVPPHQFSLSVENLSFRYSKHEPFVFSNLQFSVDAGEVVALTGPSGMGKTTLLKVMMGLLLPSSGEIRVNGMSLDQAAVLRQFSASVMQDDCLLSGTIAENIAFFSKQLDFARVVRSAALAGILEEIFRMPMKFNTMVGDMGMTLSGGQKQRVLLARALYANPKLLFLDEATSHLDVKKEQEINKSIKSLGITTIMVAHRPETIRMADRVIALSP